MVEARLTDELKLILFDTDKGKEIKSFPKKGIDPVKREAAETKFKEMKLNINTIVANQRDYLKKQFLSGEKMLSSQWMKDYLSNPVLMRIAQLLVWDQGDNLFTVKAGKTICHDGSEYTVTDDQIGIAHPIEMADKQLASWQKYFLDNQIKQFFAQVWEPLAFRTVKDLNPERYNGCMITVGNILSLEKQDLVSYRYNPEGVTDFCFADSAMIPGELKSWGHWFTERGPDNTITLGEMEVFEEIKSRKLNRAFAYLDQRIAPEKIRQDNDEYINSILSGQTLAQIYNYLKIAIECNSEKCKALLLDYRNNHYPDYTDVEEFSLD